MSYDHPNSYDEIDFWDQVEIGKPMDCWPWIGRGKQGMAVFRWVHPTTGLLQAEGAHRVAYYYSYGRLPSYVGHGCDDTMCMNPTHLRGGKGETKSGQTRKMPAMHKFTPADIVAIRTVVAEGADEYQLAEQYGVHHHVIARIVTGNWWPGVGGPLRGSKFFGLVDDDH